MNLPLRHSKINIRIKGLDHCPSNYRRFESLKSLISTYSKKLTSLTKSKIKDKRINHEELNLEVHSNTSQIDYNGRNSKVQNKRLIRINRPIMVNKGKKDCIPQSLQDAINNFISSLK